MLKRFIIFAITIIITGQSTVKAVDYKEYKYSRKQKDYFSISYNKQELTITAIVEDSKLELTTDRESINTRDGMIFANDELIFDNEGLHINKRVLPFDRITDTRITSDNGTYYIAFLTSEDQSRLARFKKGNRVTLDENIIVAADDFVRGIVFSVTGDIEIHGEVNKDVISLFGNIFVTPEATIRGDLALVKGNVNISKKASVYGEINSVKTSGRSRFHRYFRGGDEFSINEQFDYNRVDGLYLGVNLTFKDPDSLLPKVYIEGGYAFESERWRYDVGVEQTVLKNPAVSLGGSLYRQIRSGDEHIISNNENLAFTMLFVEDYKDYYEARGGTVYLKLKPHRHIEFETGYDFYNTKWMRSHRRLWSFWSIFDGDKLFDRNFHSAPELYRSASMTELDSSTNAVWYADFSYSTIDFDDPFESSGWKFITSFERSSDGLKSDYDYKRYLFSLGRYQKIYDDLTFIIKGTYGGSDGYLPIYKRYYLGGTGTLPGYDYKEYMGSRFFMINSEYRLNFPGSDIAISLIYNAGAIANDLKLDKFVELKQDLGAKLYFDNDIIISLSKRLDRSYDDKLKFFIRFAHNF